MRQSRTELKVLYELVFVSNLVNQDDLPPRSLSVLEMRLKYQYSFGIISKQLNISSERASQIYHTTLEKILQTIDFFANRNKKDSLGIEQTEILINNLPEFSPKLKMELMRLDIGSLQQLSQYKKSEVVKFKRIGNKTADYLQEILNQYHLDFIG